MNEVIKTECYAVKVWFFKRWFFRLRNFIRDLGKESNLVRFATEELELAGLFDEDSDYRGMTGEAVLKLIKVFSKQGHSGFSASIVSELFSRLSKFEPLTPLTFKDDEWVHVGPNIYQNRRHSAAFKEGKDGRPYYIDAFYLRESDGCTYNGSLDLGNNKSVTKCYIKDSKNMPSICIDVVEGELKDKGQLEELQKYYDTEIVDMREEKCGIQKG